MGLNEFTNEVRAMISHQRSIGCKRSHPGRFFPNSLNQRIQAIAPKRWLPAISIGMFACGSVVWGIYGRIPVTVEAEGVLTYPRHVVSVEAEESAQLMSLLVAKGDVVEAGELIAIVDQTASQKQLQRLKHRLAQLKSQTQRKGLPQNNNLEQAAEAALSSSEALTPLVQPTAEPETFDSQAANLAQKRVDAHPNQEKEMQAIAGEIARLDAQLTNNRQIVSQYPGRILEVMVSPGQMLQPGAKIAHLNLERPSDKLIGVGYFSVEEGQKIQPEMRVYIDPNPSNGERIGSIPGRVAMVSATLNLQEDAFTEVWNPNTVEALDSRQGSLVQVTSELELNSSVFSRYQWSPLEGSALELSPGTATIRVKIDERTPISYVAPMLRSVGTFISPGFQQGLSVFAGINLSPDILTGQEVKSQESEVSQELDSD